MEARPNCGRAHSKAKGNHPVTEQALENVWKTQRQRGVTWRDATQRFRSETERIARPTTPAETFPQNVIYESHCGAQCRMLACPQRVGLHAQLLSAFTSIVRRHGKITEAVKGDILLAADVYNTARQRFTVFAFMTAMSARSGNHAPEQIFVVARPVGDGQERRGLERFKDLDLQLCTHNWKPSKKQWLPLPYDRSCPCVGRLQMYTADEFAKMLLDMNFQGNAAPSEVVLSKLDFQDLWPSSVRVIGEDRSFEPLLVRAVPGAAPAEDDNIQDQGDGDDLDRQPLAAGHDEGHEGDDDHASGADNADSEMDLLALLLDSEAVPQPSVAKRKKKNAVDPSLVSSAGSGPDGFNEEDDFLADPEFQAILGRDEVQALREAVRACRRVAERSDAATVQPAGAGSASESEIEMEEEASFEAPAKAPSGRKSKRARPPSREPADSGFLGEGLASSTPAVASSSKQQPSSSSGSRNEAASSSSALPTATEFNILRRDDDGSCIRVVNTGRGLELCRVERERLSSDVKILGVVKRMVAQRTGKESLQAVCKVHPGCICWVSGTAGHDLLVDWLSSADREDATTHQVLAASLKMSLGMRIRRPV